MNLICCAMNISILIVYAIKAGFSFEMAECVMNIMVAAGWGFMAMKCFFDWYYDREDEIEYDNDDDASI